MHCAQYDSPLGPLCLRSNGVALVSLHFGPAEEQGETTVFSDAFRWLDAYFSGVELPRPRIFLSATPFRLNVWEQCAAVPYGQTRSYSELARAAGCPGASRAVGTALAHNPLLIIIPCHRVIPASGSVGQYAAGSALKRQLLELETNQRPGKTLG